MREELPLCVWIGKTDSEDRLIDISSWQHGDHIDDDNFYSWLETSFGLEDYDEDFRDAVFVPEGANLKEAIVASSYGDQFVDQLMTDIEAMPDIDISEVNAVLVVYHIPYLGHVKHAKAEGIELNFVGNYKYVH